MIIIVPSFVHKVCDGHWNTGWNIGQLAMFLVAVGIDCSESCFMNISGNVCGNGIKKLIPSTDFYIGPSMPYLPKGLADTYHKLRGFNCLDGSLAYASPKGYRKAVGMKSGILQEIRRLKEENNAITNSNSWKITSLLRAIKRVLT